MRSRWIAVAGALGLGVLAAARAEESLRMIERTVGKYRVRIDPREQKIGLDIPEDRGYAGFDEERRKEAEAPIVARIADIPGRRGRFVSAAMLAQKAKQFDDGLYAAVELLAQRGAGGFAGKAALVRALAERSKVAEALAAAKLGGLDVAPPADRAEAVDAIVEAFLGDALRSKPIGFYTWSEELGRIFRQDRMLQSAVRDPRAIADLAAPLREDAALRASYEQALRLNARLTNPAPAGVLDLCAVGSATVGPDGVRVLPPLRSHEADLVKRLFGNGPIPEGFSLADAVIERVRAGTLDLKPRPDSGWYDRQTWALEPLLVPDETPEAARLHLEPAYRKSLEDLFRALVALTRETHTKQLEIPAAGAAPPRPSVDLTPALAVEPLATHYLRRAQAYAFVRGVLEETFGKEALAGARRLTAAGPVERPLLEELAAMEALFLGACAQARADLGLEADGDPAAFAAWAGALESDPDLGIDARMMVPLFYDIGREKTKVLVFLGWTARPLRIWWEKSPKVEVVGESGVDVRFRATTETLAYPVTAEVYVTEILDREEFRAHCDRWKTQKEIIANLK